MTDPRDRTPPLKKPIGKVGQEPVLKPDPFDSSVARRLDQSHGALFGMEDAGELGVGKALSELKGLDYGYLVPFKKILSPELLRKKAVRMVLVFGLLPLVYSWFAYRFQLDFVQVMWLIEIYFCLFWALYFYSVIRPPNAVWRRGIGYATFTAMVGIPVLLAAQRLPVISNLYAGTDSASLPAQVIGFVFGVGVLEELCKASPLLIFGLRKKTIRGIRDGVFLGLLSGFGFAAAEGVSYTVGATARALQTGAVTSQVIVFLDRIMSGPLQHGAWAGVVGWFIGVAALRRGPKWPIVTVGIAFMAILHGLYDVFSSSILGIALAGIGFVVFMGYLIHGEQEGAISEAPARAGPPPPPPPPRP